MSGINGQQMTKKKKEELEERRYEWRMHQVGV
jgi:hypothetical protein